MAKKLLYSDAVAELEKILGTEKYNELIDSGNRTVRRK